MTNKEDKTQRSFLFKLVNSIVGTRGEFFLTLILSLAFGILYSFKIWDKVAILFIFGMILPAIYIAAAYKLLQQSKITTEGKRIVKWFKRSTTNTILMVFDMLFTIAVGLLVYFEKIDYVIVRLLLTVVFPFVYLNALHMLINEDAYIKDQE